MTLHSHQNVIIVSDTPALAAGVLRALPATSTDHKKRNTATSGVLPPYFFIVPLSKMSTGLVVKTGCDFGVLFSY